MILNALIIDDDPVFRIYLQKLVDSHQHLHLAGTAVNGSEALEHIHSLQPDLIFLDINMPDMTGFEVLDTVKQSGPAQVIITSSSTDHGIKAFDYGITDYLVKPFDQERFNEAIERVVRNARKGGKALSLVNTLALKTLQYIHSRDLDSYRPIPSRSSKVGYVYPMLTENLDFNQQEKAFEILEIAEKASLLTSTFIDSFYACNECYNSYLLFRETCPACQSSDVFEEEMIHHFPCAYVGPISDFKSTGDFRDLICPKCDRELKHIGVDYDKPSTILTCNRCDHIFQDPVVKAKCNHCNTDPAVENLIKMELKSYHITNLGRDAALGNVIIDIDEMEDLREVIDKTSFQRLLSKEIERMRHIRIESSIAYVTLDNITELYGEIGTQKSRGLMKELLELVQSEIRRTDEVVFQNMVTVWFLFPEMDREQALQTLRRIMQRVKLLVDDNFEGFNLKLSGSARPINTTESADKQLYALSNNN